MAAAAVLVVDDSSAIRLMLGSFLTREGFAVREAVNGAEGLAAARDTPPDLVLLDLDMPEMDGFEFLRRYRPTGQAPVLMITGSQEPGAAVTALELGADGFFPKPLRLHELAARIRSLLRRTGCAAGPVDSSSGARRNALA